MRWRALAGVLGGPSESLYRGVEGSRRFPVRLKTHRTCYNRADTRRDGARKGQHTCCEVPSLGRSPSPVHAPGLDAGGKDRQRDSNTGSEGAPRSEGRSRVLRGRGRRTALALGGGAGDREGIVLLVGGRPGPLRLWLILLILLLHQRDGGRVERAKEEGVGDQVARPRPQTLRPPGGIVNAPPPGQGRDLEFGDGWDVPGQGCLRPSDRLHLPSIPAASLGSGVWELENSLSQT